MSTPVRLGIFGGTFDPVHIGHLVAATEVRAALDLDRVLLVVANEPWQKVGTRPLTPAPDRLAVVEASVADRDDLEASPIEIERGGPSYTVDTVNELRRRLPGAELYLVVGDDVAAELGSWHRTEDLPDLVTLVVVARAGYPEVPLPLGWRARRVVIPALEISSSWLRERIAAGGAVDYLVPGPAIERIVARGLYAAGR
jgi:nicotinate-nucleotide adenylyltransferase